MAKHVFLLVMAGIIHLAAFAQRGDISVSINAEAAIPGFQKEYGFGLFVKGEYGVGKAAQLTASLGISRLALLNTAENGDVTIRYFPILFGYKQKVQSFFVEPKVGFGAINGRIIKNGDFLRPSTAAVFGGLSAGAFYKRISAGISFLTAYGIEKSSAGIWHDKNFHYTSIFVGYKLFARS